MIRTHLVIGPGHAPAYCDTMNQVSTPHIRRRPRRDRDIGKTRAGARVSRADRPRPNRIYELTQERGWTYAQVGELCEPPQTEKTIMRLANGDTELTVTWMNRFAKVFQVQPLDILVKQSASNLRSVTVSGSLQAGAWAEHHDWPPDQHYDVMIPDDSALRDETLYAGEIKGNSMNLRYAPGSVAILSKTVMRPNEIIEGRRYHVRVTRIDGTTEETIKLLVRRDNRYWLKPESDDPAHQEWIPLEGKPGETVEIIGRVRFIVSRED